MPATTIVRPDFSAMNGQALVDAYNQYVDKWRTSKFSSKAEGVEACNKAFDRFVQKTGMVEAKDTARIQIPEPVGKPEDHIHDLALIGKMDCPDETKVKLAKVVMRCPKETVKKSAAEPRAEKPRTRKTSGTPRKSKNSTRVIKIKALRNPRREGSKAWAHFEVMNSADVRTVADYLAKFPPEARKNANQWLSNTVADGFVELVDEA